MAKTHVDNLRSFFVHEMTKMKEKPSEIALALVFNEMDKVERAKQEGKFPWHCGDAEAPDYVPLDVATESELHDLLLRMRAINDQKDTWDRKPSKFTVFLEELLEYWVECLRCRDVEPSDTEYVEKNTARILEKAQFVTCGFSSLACDIKRMRDYLTSIDPENPDMTNREVESVLLLDKETKDQFVSFREIEKRLKHGKDVAKRPRKKAGKPIAPNGSRSSTGASKSSPRGTRARRHPGNGKGESEAR